MKRGAPLTVNEAADIRLVGNGIRPFFLMDIPGIIYSFYRKMYTLGVVLIAWFISLVMIKYIFDVNPGVMFSISISFNLMLVIFGREIEEFILKKRGFEIMEFETARNKGEAAWRLHKKLGVKL